MCSTRRILQYTRSCKFIGRNILSTDNELNVIDSANKTLSFVQVPKTHCNWSLKNSKERLDVAIKIAGSEHGGTYESVYRIANYLCRFYKISVLLHAWPKQSPWAIIWAQHHSHQCCAHHKLVARGNNKRETSRAHLGLGFCPTQRSVIMLSEGHGVVHYGSIDFTYEGKQQTEFVGCTEKYVEKIARYY